MPFRSPMPGYVTQQNQYRHTLKEQYNGPGFQVKYFNCKTGGCGGGRYRCTDTCYGSDCPEGKCKRIFVPYV